MRAGEGAATEAALNSNFTASPEKREGPGSAQPGPARPNPRNPLERLGSGGPGRAGSGTIMGYTHPPSTGATNPWNKCRQGSGQGLDTKVEPILLDLVGPAVKKQGKGEPYSRVCPHTTFLFWVFFCLLRSAQVSL